MIRRKHKKPAVSLTQREIDELHSIGAALAAERDLDRLLARILEGSRHIVRADAGTLFLAEKDDKDRPTQLRFKLAQNDSVPLQLDEFVIPINTKSLAGYVAKTRNILSLPDVYRIRASYPFRFNVDVDRQTGYRSKSVLAIPMIDHEDQLIGVVQLWNKKKTRSTKLRGGDSDSKVIPFTPADRKLLASLAAQAAVAIENARLYSDIKGLFKGFIRAAAVAIESRDPTTRGHSERVAKLTVDLAREVSRCESAPFGAIRFTKDQLQEIEYAALLHDFGKIGVRESLLLKSKKLYPWELDIVRERLDLLSRNAEADAWRRKADCLAAGGAKDDAAWISIETELAWKLENIRRADELIRKCNEPTVLPEEIQADLRKLSEMSVPRSDGTTTPLMLPDQICRLSIPKGSLSDEERRQVESHVTHTHDFLTRIPWTRDLREIPALAHGHHEKLDGSGYPLGLSVSRIPLPARMMAIADIFDALVALDRPYKKAVPLPVALDILRREAEEGKLDRDLVNLFIDRHVYRRMND